MKSWFFFFLSILISALSDGVHVFFLVAKSFSYKTLGRKYTNCEDSMSHRQYRNHKRNIIEVAQLNLLGNQCSSGENGLKMRNSIKIAINQYFQEKIWLIVFEGPRRWLQVKVAFFLDLLYPFERSRLEMMRNVSVCNSEMRSCSFWEPQNRRIDKNSCRPDVFSFWVAKSSRMVILLTEQHWEQLVAV